MAASASRCTDSITANAHSELAIASWIAVVSHHMKNS
jgi:hypothetical protein